MKNDRKTVENEVGNVLKEAQGVHYQYSTVVVNMSCAKLFLALPEPKPQDIETDNTEPSEGKQRGARKMN